MTKRHKKKPNKAKPVKKETPNLYEGISKCLESGHVSFASFDVVKESGISKLHACSQCGLMFWEA